VQDVILRGEKKSASDKEKEEAKVQVDWIHTILAPRLLQRKKVSLTGSLILTHAFAHSCIFFLLIRLPQKTL
jgi:hypothetical protein